MTINPTYEELKAKVEELERLRETIDFLPDAIFEMDANGKFIFANQKGFEKFGYTQEDLSQGVNALELIILQDRERALRSIQRSLKGKETGLNEYTALKKDGTTFPIQIHSNPILRKGEVIGIRGSIVDLSERKRAEDELRESQEQLRLFTEQTLLSVVILQDSRIVYANKAYSELTGYPFEEIKEWKIEDTLKLVHPDYRELVIEQGHKKMSGENDGTIANYQYKGFKKSGEEGWIDQYSQTILYKGKPADMIVMNEITERKLTEQALKQSEELFRLIFQVSPDSISINGPNEEYIDVNPGFTVGSGYTREEALGVTSEDLNLWVDDGSIEEVRKTLTERGIINNLEARFRHKDGSISDNIFSATVFEINGEYYVLSVARNITELKEAQKERSLLEAQLQQVQKMESIGTLAGGIAHDFNNLLMSIQGKTSILLHNMNKDDAVYDQIKSIEQLIKSGSKVTNQLLGFARKGNLEVKPEDLNKLVKNSSKMFATTKKEIKIHIEYQKYVWAVEVDKNQIDQVLLNLFVNASQAMPNGGDLYIETENVMLDEVYVNSYLVKPGKFVKISITDTGIGMDEATLPNIFDPFFTTKDVGTETGLGLASAYGIIKNHDGIINAYSEKGVGSTFNIYLPATDKKVIEGIEPQSKIKKGTETILFIDDEPRIIDTGKEMLEILGYKVLLAASGTEAIETYRKKSKMIDLVILDMILPEMDGSVIFDRLRDINPNTKVLLSSGFTQDGKAEEILNKGCNGFIQKPFTLEQLSHKISKILSMK